MVNKQGGFEPGRISQPLPEGVVEISKFDAIGFI